MENTENICLCFDCDHITRRVLSYSETFQTIMESCEYPEDLDDCNWCEHYNMPLRLVHRKYKCKHFKKKSEQKQEQDDRNVFIDSYY